MADPFSDTLKSLRSKAVAFGSEPLLARPNGTVVDLANGYIPLLANFTFEDKAAKGLRRRKAGDEREVTVYFSAVELAEDILDEWIKVVDSYGTSAKYLPLKAYEEALGTKGIDQRSTLALPTSLLTPALFCSAIQQLLAAQHLATLSVEEVLAFYNENPIPSQPVIRSCLVRLAGSHKADTLLGRLLDGKSPEPHRAALVIADIIPKDSQFEQSIAKLALEVVEGGLLTAKEREKAGRILSSLGDPRNLTGLAQIPAGTFVMGSESHPNSQPPNSISIGSFRIGIYPVVNRDYSAFARGTGRDWLSPDGTDPERLNAPATDLTWHDARAYCRWLTDRWRLSGEITPNDEVRLPTEPEWERASRGGQVEAGRESWCPDVRAALPHINAAFSAETAPNMAFVEVGQRPEWKVPTNVYRTKWDVHNVPTIVRYQLVNGEIKETGRLVEGDILDKGRLQALIQP
ncbi:Serine/threonine-protein kinase pkn1 [Colletotrichum sp. SAR11_240]|nr:Serine/threonine-protein kinase pkn1 [Colletotrichum sp. SAR11_240]